MLSNASLRRSPIFSANGLSATSVILSTMPFTSSLTKPSMPDPPPSMNDGNVMPATASLIQSGMPSVIAFMPASTSALNPSETVFPGEAP